MQLISRAKSSAAPDVILAVVAAVETVARPDDFIAAGIHSRLDAGRRLTSGFIMERIEALARMEAVLHPNISAIRVLVGITLIMVKVPDVVARHDLADCGFGGVHGRTAHFEPMLRRRTRVVRPECGDMIIRAAGDEQVGAGDRFAFCHGHVILKVCALDARMFHAEADLIIVCRALVADIPIAGGKVIDVVSVACCLNTDSSQAEQSGCR